MLKQSFNVGLTLYIMSVSVLVSLVAFEHSITLCLQVNSNSATMGFLLSKSMDANFKKQQEFMLHNARLQVSKGAPTQIVLNNIVQKMSFALMAKATSCTCNHMILCDLLRAGVYLICMLL